MKRTLALLLFMLTSTLFAQNKKLFPLINGLDTLGCIVVEGKERINYQFPNLSEHNSLQLVKAYPNQTFILVDETKQRELIQEINAAFAYNRDLLNNTSDVVENSSNTPKIYSAGYKLQASVLAQLGTYGSLILASTTQLPEFWVAAASFSGLSLYLLWSAGNDLKESSVE